MSQCRQIIDYCKRHSYITNKEAVEHLSCYRLAARIADLESRGHKFAHTMVYYTNGSGEHKKYMIYKLIEERVS